MPSMADIAVKKHDGTTNVTFTAMTPSSGDKTAAKWRCESIGTVAANRPTMDLTSRSSANGKFRLIDVIVTFPESYTDSTTGLVKMRDRNFFKGQFAVGVELTDTTAQEFASQTANLLSSVLVKASIISGYAPT